MDDLAFITADDSHVSEEDWDGYMAEHIGAQFRILRLAATIEDLPAIVEVARQAIVPDEDIR